MNKIALKICGFVLAVIGLFIAIGNSIPQIGSYPPRAISKEDFVAMSSEQIVAKGKEVFGAGGERCSQCHIVGEGPAGRGPSLAGVGARAGSRRKGVRARDYILESLLEPKAFVVEGFSPIMPEVYKAPLDLSEYDILAVAAFLESQGGAVTIDGKYELKAEWAQKVRAAKAAGASKPPTGDLAGGTKLFNRKLRCVACHQTVVDGRKVGGVLGPDLSGIGAIQGPDYLRESIVEPSATVVSPYKDIMPKHFKANLTEAELDDLVVFLLTLRAS